MVAIRKLEWHKQQEGFTLDPQKYFLMNTSNLSKAACYMTYVKISFIEGWWLAANLILWAPYVVIIIYQNSM